MNLEQFIIAISTAQIEYKKEKSKFYSRQELHFL